jgi:hypothetical protein
MTSGELDLGDPFEILKALQPLKVLQLGATTAITITEKKKGLIGAALIFEVCVAHQDLF